MKEGAFDTRIRVQFLNLNLTPFIGAAFEKLLDIFGTAHQTFRANERLYEIRWVVAGGGGGGG